MSRVPLSGEETRIVFAGEARDNLADLDTTDQRAILRRLLDIAEAQAPPGTYVHETIANLDIVAVGGQCRLYTKVVENIPTSNATYHVIYVFYIDETHDYDTGTLATYSPAAEARAEEVTGLGSVRGVESCLDEQGALSPADLRDLLP